MIDTTEPKDALESYLERPFFAERENLDFTWLKNHIHPPEGQRFSSRFDPSFEPRLIGALGRAFGVSEEPATSPEAARDETEKLRRINATLYYVAEKGFAAAYADIPELESAINELAAQQPRQQHSGQAGTSDSVKPHRVGPSRRRLLESIGMGLAGAAFIQNAHNSIDSEDPYMGKKQLAYLVAVGTTGGLVGYYCHKLGDDFKDALESGDVHKVTPLIDDSWNCEKPEAINSRKHVDALFGYMEKWMLTVREIYDLMGKKPGNLIEHTGDTGTTSIGDYRPAGRGR